MSTFSGEDQGEQRKAKTKNSLDLRRVELLDQLGFGWDLVALAWENKFAELLRL